MIRGRDDRSDELRSMFELLTWVDGGAIHWKWKHRNNAGFSGRGGRLPVEDQLRCSVGKGMEAHSTPEGMSKLELMAQTQD